MACTACVAKERENERANKGRFLRRGLLFAVPAAILGCYVKWRIEDFAGYDGSSSLYSVDAFLRGAGTFLLGLLIGTTAIIGAKKRGSRPLQVSAVILTYLAYCMAFVPVVLSKVPPSEITAVQVVRLMLLATVAPFLALTKNLIAITGLAAVFVACSVAWSATTRVIQVTGPFDCTDRMPEKGMFKGLEG